MNDTQVIKSAINAFIVLAVCISLFQQLNFQNNKNLPINNSDPSNNSTQNLNQQQLTGPKLQGIRIYASDKFHSQIKNILIKNQVNIEISSYEFQGHQYWLNLILNWGHMVLIYVLMNKYKTQTDQSTKKKIMIGGAIAVMAWFYISGTAKPQRYSIQVQGSKIMDKNYIDQKEIVEVLHSYQFQFDDMKQAQKQSSNIDNTVNPSVNKQDAWKSNRIQTHQQVFQPEIQF